MQVCRVFYTEGHPPGRASAGLGGKQASRAGAQLLCESLRDSLLGDRLHDSVSCVVGMHTVRTQSFLHCMFLVSKSREVVAINAALLGAVGFHPLIERNDLLGRLQTLLPRIIVGGCHRREYDFDSIGSQRFGPWTLSCLQSFPALKDQCCRQCH